MSDHTQSSQAACRIQTVSPQLQAAVERADLETEILCIEVGERKKKESLQMHHPNYLGCVFKELAF